MKKIFYNTNQYILFSLFILWVLIIELFISLKICHIIYKFMNINHNKHVIYNSISTEFNSESLEHFLFFGGIFLFPFLFINSFYIGKKIFDFFNKKFSINNVYTSMLIITIIIFFIWGEIAFFNSHNDSVAWAVYTKSIIIKQSFLAFVLLHGSFIWFIFFHTWGHSKNKEKILHITKLILKYGYIPVILFTCSYSIFTANAITPYPIFYVHLDAVAYSLGQYLMGDNLWTLNGLRNTYGAYPIFFKPFFLFLPINVLSLTLVMCLFILGTFYFSSKLLNIIKDIRVRLLGIGTMLFFGYFMWRAQYIDLYFQFFPMRTFFPILTLYLIANYQNNPTYFKNIIFSFIITLGLLLNIEFGLISIMLWIIAIMLILFNYKNKDQLLTKSFKILSLTLIVIIGEIGCFIYLYQYFSPDPILWQMVFNTLDAFSAGLNMLPMSILHAWNIYIIICLFAIIICFMNIYYSWINKTEINKQAFLSGIIGFLCIGVFGYYVGRSHDLNLTTLFIFIYPLPVIFVDYLLKQEKKLQYLSIPILMFLSIWLLEFPTHFRMLSHLFIPNVKSWFNLNNNSFNEQVAFIKNNSSKQERILIIAKNQGLLFLEANRKSAFHPGLIDILWKHEVLNLQNIINTPGIKIFIDKDIMELKYLNYVTNNIDLSNHTLIKTQSPLSLYTKLNP